MTDLKAFVHRYENNNEQTIENDKQDEEKAFVDSEEYTFTVNFNDNDYN